MKYFLLASALLVILLLLLWPQFHDLPLALSRSDFAETMKKMLESKGTQGITLYHVTSRGDPIVLRAESAQIQKQPKANKDKEIFHLKSPSIEITPKEEPPISVQGKVGTFRKSESRFSLRDNALLRFGEHSSLRAKVLHLDFDSHSIWGIDSYLRMDRVKISGPSVLIQDNGTRITFFGKSRMIVLPLQEEEETL